MIPVNQTEGVSIGNWGHGVGTLCEVLADPKRFPYDVRYSVDERS